MKVRDALLTVFISIFANLPLGILYIFSGLLAFLLQHVFNYRRKVVAENLRLSFPEKDTKEINLIIGRFYRNLADLIVEIIKSPKLSARELEARVSLRNAQLLDELYKENRSVFISLGHCGNWEWVGNRIALILHHEGAAIYKPLRDKFFDDYMVGLRQKYKGTLMIDYKKVSRTLITLRMQKLGIFVLADQSPARTEMDHFEEFLGRRTAFYDGMEKVARAFDFAVVYLDVQRICRGRYEASLVPITRSAKESPVGFVTGRYVNLLENTVRQQPDNWLWSHRRWKEKVTN